MNEIFVSLELKETSESNVEFKEVDGDKIILGFKSELFEVKPVLIEVEIFLTEDKDLIPN